MYKNQGFKVNTRPISVRLREDILQWMEMEGINRNAFINDKLTEHMKTCQRLGRQSFEPWTRKNR